MKSHPNHKQVPRDSHMFEAVMFYI